MTSTFAARERAAKEKAKAKAQKHGNEHVSDKLHDYLDKAGHNVVDNGGRGSRGADAPPTKER